jgi:hypothetical protein
VEKMKENWKFGLVARNMEKWAGKNIGRSEIGNLWRH